MVNDQLLEYIRKQLALNVSKEIITSNLKGAGWADTDISEVFSHISPPSMPTSTPTLVAISPVVPTIAPNTFPAKTIQAEPSPKVKSKKVPLIVLTLILLCATGAAAYAYYSGVFVSLPSLVSEAMDNARKTTSANYDVTFNFDFSEMKDMTDGLNLMLPLSVNSSQASYNIKGSYDTSDSKNFKNSSVLSLNIGSFSLGAELRVVNNTLYAMLTKIPVSDFFPMTMSTYENKWFSYSFESTDENGQIVNNPLATIFPVDPNIPSELTADQKDYLYKMFRDAHLIKMIEKLTPETIDGESSYHFSFDLDRVAIDSYLQSLKEYINSISKDDSQLSAFDPTSFTKGLDNLKDFKGEIWIGRNDKLIHKIIINFGIQPDQTKNEQIKLNLVGIMSGWNQPVSIIAPAESTPFETLFGDAQQKGEEAVIKATMSNLRAQAEVFLVDNQNIYSGFCASQELKTTRESIESNGGTGFVCKDTKTKYLIGVKLPQDSGYWCVDSTGISKSTTTLPSGTVCPIK